jgi:hypothetical protein
MKPQRIAIRKIFFPNRVFYGKNPDKQIEDKSMLNFEC